MKHRIGSTTSNGVSMVCMAAAGKNAMVR